MKISNLLLSALTVIICCICVCGCLTTADYEDIYSDNAKIATCSSNVRVGSAQIGIGSEYKWSCSSFSGVYPIKDVKSSAVVNLSLKVEKGKLKIVAVKGNEVYTVAENSFDGALDFTKIPSGNYELKAVGVEAKFSLILTY